MCDANDESPVFELADRLSALEELEVDRPGNRAGAVGGHPCQRRSQLPFDVLSDCLPLYLMAGPRPVGQEPSSELL